MESLNQKGYTAGSMNVLSKVYGGLPFTLQDKIVKQKSCVQRKYLFLSFSTFLSTLDSCE